MYSTTRGVLWDQSCSLDQSQAHHTAAVIRKPSQSRRRSCKDSPREDIRLPSVHIRLPLPSPGCSGDTGLGVATTPPLMQGQDQSCAQDNMLNSSRHDHRQRKEVRANALNKDARNKRSQTKEKVSSLVGSSSSALPLIPNASVLPFDGPSLEGQCPHCGLYVTTQSLTRHKNWCSRLTRSKSKPSAITKRPEKLEGGERIVARVVTVGLTPGGCEQVFFTSKEEPERPQTRTLPYSSLHHTGHGIPSTSTKYPNENSSGVQQCKSCDRIVATDKLDVHHRMCQSVSPRVSTRTVSFPPTRNLLRVGQDRDPHPHAQRCQKPPTVVCYICGREYGSKSISIHEPQCLKKFNIQNDKLPIKDRLPFPKKRKTVAIVREISREEVVVQACSSANAQLDQENMVQRFFENCYSEFERDLVPCKKCGRTFAPERYTIHEPNCNAKPLKKS